MQTQIHFKGNDAYWKNFKWGTIFPSESTFQVVPRNRSNIMKMYHGLGCNEELLYILKQIGIRYIEIPFDGKLLKTTVDIWINRGIKSPFCSEKVDQQIILPLSNINVSGSQYPNSIAQSQMQLFQRGI